jgi:hypothetical protein
MLDLFGEFKTLISRLSESRVSYALCGGLALAVYGLPRATVDIDLLIPPETLAPVMAFARELGYSIEAKPMTFAKGAIDIRRISKIDPDSDDLLSLDLLLVTPATTNVWDTRAEVEWEGGKLWVVSREGLIFLKSLRSSGQDTDDIRQLREEKNES